MQWTCAPGSVGGDGGVDLAAFVAERGVPDGGVFSCADTDSLGGASPSSSVVVLEDVRAAHLGVPIKVGHSIPCCVRAAASEQMQYS